MSQLVLELPFPPSVNTYWRNVGKTMLSQRARLFRRVAKTEIEAQLWQIRPRPPMFKNPVAVKIRLHPPDAKRRDLDNMAKAILDVLTHAGIWQDDSLAHELHLSWGEVEPDGRAVLEITELGHEG